MAMLIYLNTDSEWANQRLELIREHQLERTTCYKGEEQTWQALGHTHFQQRLQLAAQPFSAQAQGALIKSQTQNLREWRTEKLVSRAALRTRQNREIADLDRKRQA